MSTLFKRIDTVFLKVKDFDQSIAWYCNILEFSLRWKDEVNGYAALNIGETPLTLVRARPEEQMLGTKIAFNFYCPDIEQAHEHLVRHNVNVSAIHEDESVKWFKFEDLEGNELEVCSF